MHKPIAEQVVVVTGASSGIGLATARLLGSRGASVVVTARSTEVLEQLAREIEGRGGRALAVPAEITDEAQVGEVARRAVERFGRIDCWINLAAVFIQGEVRDIEYGEFRRVVDVNLLGYVNGTQHALRQMRRQGHGTIIMVSSVLAHRAAAYFSAYAAAKSGVDGFAEALRAELWGTGVRVATLYLPPIDTPIYHHARGKFGTVPKPPPLVVAPEKAAEKLVKLVQRPRATTSLGPMGVMFRVLSSLPHPFADYLFHRVDQWTRSDQPDTGDNLDAPVDELPRVRQGWMRYGWRGFKPGEFFRLFRVELLIAAVLLAGGAAWWATRRHGARSRRRRSSLLERLRPARSRFAWHG